MVFLGEDDAQVFEGDEFLLVLEHLAHGIGCNSALFKEGSAELGALKVLRDRGLITEQLGDDTPRRAYWDSMRCRGKSAEISFENILGNWTKLFSQAFRSNHLDVTERGELLVIITDDYQRPEIAKLSKRRTPFLLAKPVGHTIWLGPLISPGQFGCYSCLLAALKRGRWLQTALAADGAYIRQPSVAALPSTVATCAAMVSTAAAIFLSARRHSQLEDQIVTLDTRAMTCAYNRIPSFGNCPECSGRPSRPVSMHSHLSPITGIVRHIDVVERSVGGLYHAAAEYVGPARQDGRGLFPQQALGKGFSPFEAEERSIAEALERYCSIYQGTELLIRGKVGEVGGVRPNDILLYSQRQYASRKEWNICHSQLHWIPDPLEERAELSWAKASSMISEEEIWVPAGIAYMNFPFDTEPQFCSGDSNGCAAASTLDRAKLAALLELVERDAMAIWWYNRLRRPKIDLASCCSSRVQELAESFCDAELRLQVLDITTDLRIPAYVAVASAKNGTKPCLGSAAHPSPAQAALGAMSEAAQVWFWSSRGGGSDELKDWLARASIDTHQYLTASGITEASRNGGMSVDESLEFCCARLEHAGIHPYYVNLTRPEVGVPVVRAIAPGLRHFWARFAPGRLYDVPVTLGFLDHPLKEDELNPVPCMQ